MVVLIVVGSHTARVGAYSAGAGNVVNRGQAWPRASHRLPHLILKNSKQTRAQQEAEQSNQQLLQHQQENSFTSHCHFA
eukprot:364208-Chlamydomonas_euryale.AAC.24